MRRYALGSLPLASLSAPPVARATATLATLALLGTLCAAALPAPLLAQSPVTTTAEVTFLTDYLFAGIPFASEEVTQARLSVSAGSFTVNGFSVWDHDRSEITELDLYADYYEQVAPAVGVFVGGALYSFDYGTSWESTPELYGGVVLTAPLNPTLYVAHDFDLGDGTHATLMLSESVPLGSGGLTLDLAGNVDYNDDYYVDFSGLSYADLAASVGIPAGPVTVSPMFLVQFSLDDDFTTAAFLSDDVQEVFGVSVSATF